MSMTPVIKAVNITDNYALLEQLMRALQQSEQELFDKTTAWEEISANYMRHIVDMQKENDGTCLVAYLEGQPVGFIFGYLEEQDESRIEIDMGEILYVSDGFVRPQYRRQGIYKQLNDELERIYITKGIRRMIRYTLSGNVRMQHFLEKEGYKPVRLLYEKWLDAEGHALPLGLKVTE
jgi:ribosomal protein S18 acetylase RimI-like enzyme